MIFIISKWILSKLRIEFQYGTLDDILSTYTMMIIIILDDKIKYVITAILYIKIFHTPLPKKKHKLWK